MALVHVNSVCGLRYHKESTVLKWLQHICSEHYGETAELSVGNYLVKFYIS